MNGEMKERMMGLKVHKQFLESKITCLDEKIRNIEFIIESYIRQKNNFSKEISLKINQKTALKNTEQGKHEEYNILKGEIESINEHIDSMKENFSFNEIMKNFQNLEFSDKQERDQNLKHTQQELAVLKEELKVTKENKDEIKEKFENIVDTLKGIDKDIENENSIIKNNSLDSIDLKKQLNENHYFIKSLEAEIATQVIKIKKAEANVDPELIKENPHINDLKETFFALKDTLKEREEFHKNNNNELESKNRELTSKKSRVENLLNSKESMNTKKNELEMNLKNILYKIEEMEKKIDKLSFILKPKNSELRMIKEKSYNEFNKAKSQLNTFDEKIKKLERIKSKKQADLLIKKSQIDYLNTEINSIDNKVSLINEQVALLNGKEDMCREEYYLLITDVEKAREEHSKINGEITDIRVVLAPKRKVQSIKYT